MNVCMSDVRLTAQPSGPALWPSPWPPGTFLQSLSSEADVENNEFFIL